MIIIGVGSDALDISDLRGKFKITSFRYLTVALIIEFQSFRQTSWVFFFFYQFRLLFTCCCLSSEHPCGSERETNKQKNKKQNNIIEALSSYLIFRNCCSEHNRRKKNTHAYGLNEGSWYRGKRTPTQSDTHTYRLPPGTCVWLVSQPDSSVMCARSFYMLCLFYFNDVKVNIYICGLEFFANLYFCN